MDPFFVNILVGGLISLLTFAVVYSVRRLLPNKKDEKDKWNFDNADWVLLTLSIIIGIVYIGWRTNYITPPQRLSTPPPQRNIYSDSSYSPKSMLNQYENVDKILPSPMIQGFKIFES